MGYGKLKDINDAVPILVYIEADTKKKLKIYAINQNVTMSELLRVIIDSYLDTVE